MAGMACVADLVLMTKVNARGQRSRRRLGA